MRYIVINIGCIECGVSSNVVGVFTDKSKADDIATRLNDTHAWREGGQNSFEVFDEPEENTINSEYM